MSKTKFLYHEIIPFEDNFNPFCLFSMADESSSYNTKIIYNNKNYSTEEERNKFFDKIKEKQKTELCKHYALYHCCPHGENCSFAHGESQLRQNTNSFQGYRTKICKLFVEDGYCVFGSRCNYIHRVKDKRYFNYSYLNNQMAERIYNELMKYENLTKEPWEILKFLSARKQIDW
ncbi:MAG: hypothetical protein MJ252_10140 [archaeon]|nr:hypothetical protein [archaeon]